MSPSKGQAFMAGNYDASDDSVEQLTTLVMDRLDMLDDDIRQRFGKALLHKNIAETLFDVLTDDQSLVIDDRQRYARLLTAALQDFDAASHVLADELAHDRGGSPRFLEALSLLEKAGIEAMGLDVAIRPIKPELQASLGV